MPFGLQRNPATMLDVYLIRHGETIYNSEHRIQGTLDSALSEKGQRQCELLGQGLQKRLAGMKIHRWYVSPQGRARQSSAIIRQYLRRNDLPEETVENDLREIDCGEAEGKIRFDLDSGLLNNLHRDPYQRFPGGQSVADLIERGKSLMDRIFAPPKTGATEPGAQQIDHSEKDNLDSGPESHRVIVVSHGNFIRALATAMTGMPAEFSLRISMGNTGLCHLARRMDDAHFKMYLWNDLGHTLGI
ncbi:MAG: histidine phosphatase family protein [Leptospiraceae bacterium]